MNDSISREDAVKTVIRKCSPICDWQVGTKKYPDCVVAEINALPSAEAEWIPCSERLPKTGDSILATYSDGEVGIVWSAKPKRWVTYIESNNLIYPIAWMPLPKPYREGGEA